MTGFLEITYGPMFAGKTSHLLEKVNNFITFNKIKGEVVRVLMINSDLDIRDELHSIGALTTHSEFKLFNLPERVDSVKVKKLNDLKEKELITYDYLAIDEAQFYPDLYEFVKKYLSRGKYIHCAGLMTDCKKEPFGEFYKIVHLAAETTFIKAYCVNCRIFEKTAVFTKKIKDDTSSSICDKKIKDDKSNIDIGGSDKYVPVCAKHY